MNKFVKCELSSKEMQEIVGGIRVVIMGICIYDSSLAKGHRWVWQR